MCKHQEERESGCIGNMKDRKERMRMGWWGGGGGGGGGHVKTLGKLMSGGACTVQHQGSVRGGGGEDVLGPEGLWAWASVRKSGQSIITFRASEVLVVAINFASILWPPPPSSVVTSSPSPTISFSTIVSSFPFL